MCADQAEAGTDEVDYRDTVFLPETDLPMRAGLPQREPEWLTRWERMGIYDRLRQKKGRTAFILHDGPPYANGHLHIGHALNKTIKDFVVRSHQMMGYDARYVPGWDCHGLPIEWKIEEQYRAKGQDKDDVDTVTFRQECRKFADQWVNIQRDEFRRLGVIGNWDNPYLTMDYHAEAVIAQDFLKLLMDGIIYQGSKPVMWSPVEKTALAEAEVEYHDHKSHQIWVRFRPLAGLDAASVVIWTTTPWTIPQNRAVAYNPAISYGVYRVDEIAENASAVVGETLVLADTLAANVQAAARITGWTRLRDVPASEFAGILLTHPYRGVEGAHGEWDYDVPMLPGDHVTEDAGTGFVHTAPSHGEDDYHLGMKHHLPMTYNVEQDGTYRADLPLFGGQAIITQDGQEGPANVSNIKQLAWAGALLAKGKVEHSYPHSWRSKAPVIYLNTPQWFAAIDRPLNDGQDRHGKTIRERALASITELVTFTPQAGRNRLQAMVESRPDWVLSRQRAWGVPLACFVKKGAKPDDPDFLLRNGAVNARITAAFEAEGADIWYAPGFKARVLDGIADPEVYDQIFDVLDVWFDSGSTHSFALRDRADGAPDGIADVYLEGTDQHRGWFQSSLLQASGTRGRAPYRNVVTHGFTLDEKGMKMSKSVGNVVAPQEVIDEYGADILRLWVAQSDYTADQRIGPKILKGTADSYRRLRNTLRYLSGALHGFDESERLSREEMPELERWILHRLGELDLQVRDGYRRFDFSAVFHALFNFATIDLSAFWFDIRKDSLYCDSVDGNRRRAARSAMDLVFHRLLTWLAPILPFTAEDVWLSRFPGDDDSVHLRDMPETPADWRDEPLARKWQAIRAARRVVTGALEVQRAAKVIGASLEAAPIVHVADAAMLAALESVDFAEICITSDLILSAEKPPQDAFSLPEEPSVAVVFRHAEGEKCQRCWQIRPDVGQHAHPRTCARCNSALG